jgi:hypothetical protein
MKLDDFKNIVSNHPDFYFGEIFESEETIRKSENQLGCKLPHSMIWLLCEHGYSDACGVSSLQESVTDTLRCRKTISLPDGIVILNDCGDSGVILLDARFLNSDGECPVIWTNTGSVHAFSETGDFGTDADIFQGFAEWSVYRLDELKDE